MKPISESQAKDAVANFLESGGKIDDSKIDDSKEKPNYKNNSFTDQQAGRKRVKRKRGL